MRPRCACGKINVKFVIIFVSVVIVLGIGAFVARNIRRKILAERDFAAGNAAYDRKDWAEAARRFREYLGRRPEDLDILRKYAESLLSTEPLEQRGIDRAIGSYRQLLRFAPDDAEACEELAKLYIYLGNFSELSYIAQQRLKQDADDPKATIWQAQSLLVDEADIEKIDTARKMLESLRKRLSYDDRGEHPEYIETCRILCQIEFMGHKNSPEAHIKAVRWLDRAIEYDPDSADALIHRSILRRTSPSPADETAREAITKVSQADLQQAQAVKTDDPRIALSLSREWMHHGQFDRARQYLQSVRDVDPAVINKYFIRASDWTIARFMQAGELAIRRNKPAEAESEAEEVLQAITDHRRRILIIPTIVRLCLTGKRNDEARKHLDEYLELRNVLQISSEADETAFLQARVAGAEGNPQKVIELLEPLTVRDETSLILLRLLGMAYSQVGRSTQASETLTRYLYKQPNDARARLLLARQHGNRGDWKSALQAARIAEELLKHDPEAGLFRIEAAMHVAGSQTAPDREKALSALSDELTKLRAEHPKLAQIRLLRARLMILQDRRDQAIQLLRQAVKDLPEALNTRLQLAALRAADGRMTEAIALCLAACDKHAATPLLWRTLAGYYRADKKLDDARKTLQRGIEAVTRNQHRHALTVDLAMLELLYGDRPTGVNLLKETAKANPRDVQAPSLLLGLPEVRSDRQTARKLLDRIRDVRGEDSILWQRHQAALWLDDDSSWRKNQQEITISLRKWIRQNPQWPTPVVLLAQMHQRTGRPEQAEQVCRDGLMMNPSAVEVADLLVGLLQKQNRNAEARQVLDNLNAAPRALAARRIRMALGVSDLATADRELKLQAAANPRNTAVRIRLARVTYARDRELKGALVWLDKAEAIQPGSMRVLQARVEMLTAHGETQIAGKLLDAHVKKTDKKTDSPPAYLARARFLEATGQKDLAEKDYRRLAELDTTPRAYRLLANFYLRTDRPDEAEKQLRQGLKAHADDLMLKRGLLALLLQGRSKSDLLEAEKILDDLDARIGRKAELLWARAALTIARSAKPIARHAARMLLKEAVKLEPTFVRGHVALIELTALGKDYGPARLLARGALEANPGNLVLLVAQARIELASGQFATAADLAESILKTNPNSADARGVLVSAAIASDDQGLLARARKSVAQALEKAPQNIGLHLGMIELATFKKEYGTARLLFRGALKSNPGNLALLVVQARTELAAEQFTTAAKLAESILKTNPDSADARGVLVSAALASRDQGLLLRARESVAQAIKKTPKNPGLHLIDARILVVMGKPEVAISELEAFAKTKAGNQNSSVLLVLVRLHRKQGNFAKADHWLALAAKASSQGDRDVLMARMRLFGQQGKYKELLALANTANSEKPDLIVLGTVATILSTSESPEHLLAAEKLFRRLVALAPKWGLARLNLAVHLFHTGKVDDAEKCYRQVLKQDENNAQALNGLAWLLATNRKDYKAALPLIDKAIKLAPDKRESYDTRGVILSNLPGRLGDACKDFEKCVELTAPDSPNRTKALLQLGRTCNKLKDHAAGRKHLAEALRIDAKNKVLTDEQRREIADILKNLRAKST